MASAIYGHYLVDHTRSSGSGYLYMGFPYHRVLNRHEKAHACIDLQIDRYDLRWEVQE